jgi:hypothetical protein
MKIRTIKPQFWEAEDLNQCEHGLRLFYIGLWCESDDVGVFPWKPGILASHIFPGQPEITPDKVTEWLKKLTDLGCITQYDNSKKQSFGKVNSWTTHQFLNRVAEWRHDGDMVVTKPKQCDNNVEALSKHCKNIKEKEEEREKETGRVKVKRVRADVPLWGDCEVIRLTQNEYDNLKKKYPDIDNYIPSVDNWYLDHHKQPVKDTAAIISWISKDIRDGKREAEPYDWRNDPAWPLLGKK